MDTILVMCLGIAAGRLFFPSRWKKWNEKVQLGCTLLLIFSMGVMLGRQENFLQELASLGLTSLLYFLVPTALSVALVYPLSRRFLEGRHAKARKEETAAW